MRLRRVWQGNRLRNPGPICVALIVALATTALAGERAEQQHPSYALFRMYCSACHGIEADGNGVRAPMLNPRPPDLTRLAQKYGSPLPKARLTEYVIDSRRGARICGERVFWKLPPPTAWMRRGTVLTVLEFLATVQSTD